MRQPRWVSVDLRLGSEETDRRVSSLVSDLPTNGLSVVQLVEASAYGVGRHVLDLSAGLIERGVTVDLVYGSSRTGPDFVDRLREVGFRNVLSVRATAERLPTTLVRMRAMRRDLHSWDVDVVHGHSSIGGMWARLLAPAAASVVYTPNAFATQSVDLARWRHGSYAAAEWLLSRRTDVLVSVSAEEQDHARALGLRPRQQRLIPNGVELEQQLPGRVAARARLDLPVEAPVVGFVGRLSPQKGLPLLFEAAPAIIEACGACIAIVGEGPDLVQLRDLAVQHGIDDNVRWLGPQHGARVMRAFDVLAVPSRYEGFPYVVLEALAAGTPVIATTSANASLVLADGRAGRSVSPTAAAMATAIIDVLTDPELAASMSTAGPSAVALCTIDAMVDATLHLYVDTVRDRPAPITS